MSRCLLLRIMTYLVCSLVFYIPSILNHGTCVCTPHDKWAVNSGLRAFCSLWSPLGSTEEWIEEDIIKWVISSFIVNSGSNLYSWIVRPDTRPGVNKLSMIVIGGCLRIWSIGHSSKFNTGVMSSWRLYIQWLPIINVVGFINIRVTLVDTRTWTITGDINITIERHEY